MSNQEYRSCPSREWLKQAAAAEEQHESISVGGLASRFGMARSEEGSGVSVFGQVIEFGRRRLGLSVEALALKADVDIRELVLIERSDSFEPSPRTIFKLADALGVPVKGLAEIAGLVEERSEQIEVAMLQFAARSEPTAKLTKDEEFAYNELVKVIVEQSE